ncbi:hypothetical protein J4E93_007944 [Alternaria ventricosa]|uniref:uncharacterized protein n=1 Tax=Alternaria ventricosa TaxID=1187951 RepID=UPI0020C33B9C|nr:uncharacterized protein J4E93_007944 [Alternaria ventricosa]KAI4641066.1 hypothetical protein J4E93_007944 [Alternaria ventricosa]
MASATQPPESQSLKRPAEADTQPPRMSKIARQGSYGTILVRVGTSKKSYLLHTDYLSHYSTLFKLRLAHDAPIYLQNVEPEVFDIFIDWLYTQKLPEPSEWDCLLVAQCLDFAGQYLIPLFEEAVGNAFVDKAFERGITPYYPTVIFAYTKLLRHTDASDRLRRLLVDYHCDKYRPGEVHNAEPGMKLEDETAEQIPIAFWKAVMDRRNIMGM